MGKHAQNLVLKFFNFIFRFFRCVSIDLLSSRLFLLIRVLIRLLGNIAARRIRLQVIFEIIQTIMILLLNRLLRVIVKFQIIVSIQSLYLLFDLWWFFVYKRKSFAVGDQLKLRLAIQLFYWNVAVHPVLVRLEV